jgi:hypothetical protein
VDKHVIRPCFHVDLTATRKQIFNVNYVHIDTLSEFSFVSIIFKLNSMPHQQYCFELVLWRNDCIALRNCSSVGTGPRLITSKFRLIVVIVTTFWHWRWCDTFRSGQHTHDNEWLRSYFNILRGRSIPTDHLIVVWLQKLLLSPWRL